MPSTRNFSELREEARRDPERARRIDEAKLRAISERSPNISPMSPRHEE